MIIILLVVFLIAALCYLIDTIAELAKHLGLKSDFAKDCERFQREVFNNSHTLRKLGWRAVFPILSLLAFIGLILWALY